MQTSREITITELPGTGEQPDPRLSNAASQLFSTEIYGGHLSPEKVRSAFGTGHLVLATDEDGGFVGAGLVHITETTANVTSIAVSPGCRGNGVGTEIMRALEHVAQTEADGTGKDIVMSIVPASDRVARLCERLGYHASRSGPDVLVKILSTRRPEDAK